MADIAYEAQLLRSVDTYGDDLRVAKDFTQVFMLCDRLFQMVMYAGGDGGRFIESSLVPSSRAFESDPMLVKEQLALKPLQLYGPVLEAGTISNNGLVNWYRKSIQQMKLTVTRHDAACIDKPRTGTASCEVTPTCPYRVAENFLLELVAPAGVEHEGGPPVSMEYAFNPFRTREAALARLESGKSTGILPADFVKVQAGQYEDWFAKHYGDIPA